MPGRHELCLTHQLAEIAGAAARLLPHDGWAWVLDDVVEAADKLRDVAAASGHAPFAKLANLIAPPPHCLRALEEFEAAYHAYTPEETLGGTSPSAEAVATLHRATKAVLTAEPRCPAELGRKVKIACIFGLHKEIQQTWPKLGLDAAQYYRLTWAGLSPIEPWYFAQSAGYNYSPAECEFGRRGGDFIAAGGFVDALLERAESTWRTMIAADVVRLNARPRREGW